MPRGGRPSITRPRLVRAFAAPAVTGSLAATLPPVAGSEAGTFSIPGATLFTETFADSNFASRGWYSIVSADRVASPAPSGMPGSLRMTWNSGQSVPSSGGMRKLFTPTDRLYIKYQQAFSSNWIGSGQTSHPHMVMALSELDDAYDGLSDNYLAFYVEVNYQSGNSPRVSFQDSRYIDPAHISDTIYAPIGEARSTCGANGKQGYADSWDRYTDPSASHGWYNARNLSAAAQMSPADTTWHTAEVEVVLNTIVGGIAQLDGICRYWWDGVLVWERTNLIMRTGTRPTLKLNQFLFTPYIGGSGSPVTQTAYIADLTVGTARPASGATWLGRKPANYTNHIVGDFDASAAVPTGAIGSERNIPGTDWTLIYDRDNGGGVSSVSRVSDPTATRSPPYVWQWYQPAGVYGGGTGFGKLFAFFPPGVTKVYACWRMKLSAGYYVHPISNKLFECFNAGGDVMVQLGRAGNYFEAYDQNTDTVYTSLNNSYPPTNQWFQVEVQMEAGNPGVVRVWLDGVLHVDHTDQPFAAGKTFDDVDLVMHMGGGGMTLAADQYVWVDEIAVYSV